MQCGFGSDMRACIPHREHGEKESGNRVESANVERLRPQGVFARDEAGEPCGDTYGEIAGEFIQSHSEAFLAWTDEVDLHHKGHRPSQTLVDA